jgi:hypothetical protein
MPRAWPQKRELSHSPQACDRAADSKRSDSSRRPIDGVRADGVAQVEMSILCLGATFPGPLSARQLDPVLDVLIPNDWAALAEQSASEPLDWGPIDRERARTILDETGHLVLRSSVALDVVEARVWVERILIGPPKHTSVILYVPFVRTGYEDPKRNAFLGRMLAALPETSWGSVTPSPSHDWDADVPEPFRRPPWIVVLPRAVYTQWYTREALLSAPATSVEEAPDGTITMQLYRHAFTAFEMETIRLRVHLETNRIDL